MNLDSLKEQLMDRWNTIWERIRDSDAYIQLRERYQNLSPSMQKIVTASGIGFVILFILLIPYSFLSTSWESVDTFENNVRLIRDFYRVQRELASTPMVPETPSAGDIGTQVSGILNQVGLSPEQINGPREITPEREANNALQPVGISEHGVEVTLMKLNVKQVSEIGTRLSQLGQGLQLTSLDMKANGENDHYYDVIFRVTGFSIPGASGRPDDVTPEESEASPPPPPSARGAKGKGA